MCAKALSLLGIRQAIFGCRNDRFGGCGSVLDVRGSPKDRGYFPIIEGVRAKESVDILKGFYSSGNPNAPDAKRHRQISVCNSTAARNESKEKNVLL